VRTNRDIVFCEIVDFVAAHPHYALTAVFLLALSEAIPVIGTVVPGSGQRCHREILLGWPLNRYPQFIDRSEAFINRYGVASAFLARLTAVVAPLFRWSQAS
jgi:hypothetical protein